MKSSTMVLAVVTSVAAGCACAQSDVLSYTDTVPYTDLAVPARSAAGAPSHWKGQLTRDQVIAATHQARIEGSIATGDAIGYPYLMKTSSPGAPALAQQSTGQSLGGPPGDGLTSDGYRFVGGEAGYVYVGRGSAMR